MLEFILEILRDFFQLQLDIWKSIPVAENVTAWDIVLVCFVLSGLGYALVSAFGGLSSQASGAYHDVQEYNNKQKIKSQYENKNKNKKENGGK